MYPVLRLVHASAAPKQQAAAKRLYNLIEKTYRKKALVSLHLARYMKMGRVYPPHQGTRREGLERAGIAAVVAVVAAWRP